MDLIEITTPTDSEEGTTMKIQNWLKKPGDRVVKDEPVVELETDKVTMEVEAPSDGVLESIVMNSGEDVLPGMVIGRINAAASTSSKDAGEKSTGTNYVDPKKNTSVGKGSSKGRINKALSPSVRRFVAEHAIDPDLVSGTGRDGRLTLNDVKEYAKKTGSVGGAAARSPASTPKTAPTLAKGPLQGRRIEHSAMRRSIADHMSSSVATAPHVTAVFELDFTAIAAHRAAHKQDFAARGTKLTYTAYFLQACVEAMREVPEVNSRWYDDAIEIFSDVNIGVGTALGDKGLIVPVINGVQSMDLFDIASALQEKIELARNGKLQPADVRGGTFTISNHGVSGSLVATPIIINQPQSAILGVGKLEKRVVVKTVDGQDVMAIRPMAYVSLTIDHRVLDGSQTNSWLSTFVSTLENWPA